MKKKLNSVIAYHNIPEKYDYVGGTDESPLAHFKKDIHTGLSRKRHNKKARPLLMMTAKYPDLKDWRIEVLFETFSQKKAEEVEEQHIRNFKGTGRDLVKSKKGLNETYNTKRANPSTRKKIGDANRKRRKK